MGHMPSPGRMAGQHLSTWRQMPQPSGELLGRRVGRRRSLQGLGSLGMSSSVSATRRAGRLWRLLIGVQVFLLVFSLAAPIGTMAADPSPSDSPAPSTAPDSSTAPDPTAAPAPTAAPD